MSADPDIDGVLKHASITRHDHGSIAHGRIFGDRKGRFADGERIRTSLIMSGPDSRGVIVTRNSVYRLEMDQ